ncbi:MAG: MBG domain-containing protein [Bacteroidales bacterium]|nr:MBG domain-containing protein [Bacteroidales bacterium]
MVKVKDSNRTYGEDNPTFSCTYTGLVNNEDTSVITTSPTITTTATADSDVGTYSITASGGVAQNYSFTYEDGTLTVLPANLAVTVNDATRVYGDENPDFTLTYSGLKNDEAMPAWTTVPTFMTDATKTSDVGTYEIDVTAEPRNYTITTKQTGTLTITQAPLMLKADDATRPYYADDPEFTFMCEGFKNEDDASVLTMQPTFTPDAIRRSYVGTYDLNARDAEAKNYAITYEPGTLTITPRTLTVTPDPVTRPYGEPNPTFTCSYEGFVNNETERVLTEKPTVTTTAEIGSNAGSYDLRVSGGKATNYTFTYQTGTLTIAPRELTVSVGDYERDYGEDNPTFVLMYDNFGAGDDENALTYKPSARTAATKTSDVGTYPITVSGGYSPNYDINYVQGSLTINRAEQIFTWEQDLSDLRVGDQVELNAIASSGLPVTFTMADNDIVDVYQAGRKTYMECLKPGTVVIKAQQEGNKNYYPTQRITKTIVVNVATSVDATEESALRIRPTAFGVRILNAEGETAHIYTPDGVLVKSTKVAGEQMDVELPKGNIYLVKIAGKSVKVSR